MKNLPALLPALLLLITGCGAKMTPVEYNDAIITEQNKIIEHILMMSNNVLDPDLAEKSRLSIIDQCENSISLLELMSDYEGNTELRDAALNLFGFYKDVASNEFKQMLNILKSPELSKEDYEALALLDQKIAAKEEPFDLAFQSAQMNFSMKYNLQLQKNQFQDAIDGR
jgi:hypothetical protein